jgi:tetratricopeptide (TPR) repeat protein
MKAWTLTCGVLLAALVLAAPAPAGDFVKLGNGKWHISTPESDPPTASDFENSKIEVVEERFDRLRFKIKRLQQIQDMPAAQVQKVFYEKSDSSYTRGAKLMNEGDLAGAAEAMQSALNSRVLWVPQYAMWDLVRIYEANRDADAAIGAIEALVRRFPKTKFLIQARVKAGLIHLQMRGDANSARREFRKIASIPGVTDDQKTEVEYWLIYIGDNQSQLRAVMSKYEDLYDKCRGKSSLAGVAIKAQLGIGRCKLKLDQHDEALKFFQEIVASAEDDLVRAGAYIGIGEAYFAMQNWVEARRAFLRVAILWESQPDYHAQALCRAGNCFLLARDYDFGARAYRELVECAQRYPGSHWAQKAQSLIPEAKRNMRK